MAPPPGPGGRGARDNTPADADRAAVACALGSGYYVGDFKVGDTATIINDIQPRVDANVGFLF